MRSIFLALLLVLATASFVQADPTCQPVGRLGNVCVTDGPDATCLTASANALNAQTCQESGGATEVCSSPSTTLLGTCQRTDQAAVCTLGTYTRCTFASGVVSCSANVGFPANGAGCGLPTMNCFQVMWGIHEPGLVIGGSGCSGGVYVNPYEMRAPDTTGILG